MIFGVSANTRGGWVSLAEAEALGYEAQDDAESLRDEVIAEFGEPDPADPVFRYLGGEFTLPDLDAGIPGGSCTPRRPSVRAWANLYPWDVDGDPAAPDRIAGLGLAGVTLAAAYHAVRAVAPFHPRHRIVTRDAAVYYRADPARWRGNSSRPARLRPAVARRPARSSAPPPRCAPAAWR